MKQISPIRLLVFGWDAAEAAQIRRIRTYLACGFRVQGFTMRRDNMNSSFSPFWPNLHLYRILNENLLKRVAAILGSVLKIARNRRLLAGADVMVARNLDMLAIAAAARVLVPGRRPPLIYECLDIHRLMTAQGLKGRLFRWAERRLLGRCAALIVSSPAFIRNYFGPVQGWTGPTAVIENKLWIEGVGIRPSPGEAPPRGPITDEDPLVLGWIGTLRCAHSLALLAEAADAMGPRLRIEMHGIVHHHALPAFEKVVGARANMVFKGPYEYPDGLAPIYSACDLVWSQDLWQWGTNSTWLLPNRIYEASYFGCPSLAVTGTETGRRVDGDLGWTIESPTVEALVELLNCLTAEDLYRYRTALLSRPENEFRQSAGEIRKAVLLPLESPKNLQKAGERQT